jgi:integrase/recombinase XerD
MTEIRWEVYPLVAQHELARIWLTMQSHLHLAPATIGAYGCNLNDYLAFCSKHSLLPETITCEARALYVQDLASRPNHRDPKMVSIGSGCGLSRATMQQLITVIRLYHDSLIEKQIRLDNPVGRGSYRISRASLPSLLFIPYSFTSRIRDVPKWKIDAARTASAPPSVNPS